MQMSGEVYEILLLVVAATACSVAIAWSFYQAARERGEECPACRGKLLTKDRGVVSKCETCGGCGFIAPT